MIPILGAFLLVAALLPATDSWAADQTITLRLGAGSALMLGRPFKTVLISDPDIVDVRTQSERAVMLVPLDLGAANLVFLDQDSIAIANVRVEVLATGANRAAGQDRSAAIAAHEPDQFPIVVSRGRSLQRVAGYTDRDDASLIVGAQAARKRRTARRRRRQNRMKRIDPDRSSAATSRPG